MLLPDRDSQAEMKASARGARLSSPSTIFGQIEAEQASVIGARWSNLDAYEYAYLMAFWRTGAKRNAGQFLISLPIRGSTFEECRAKFVGGLRASGFTGATATIEAQVAVMPTASRYPLSTEAATRLAGIATDSA